MACFLVVLIPYLDLCYTFQKAKKKQFANIAAIFLDFYSLEMKIYKITCALG